MSSTNDIHRDTFHVPTDMGRIPKGMTRWINGTQYVWTGKKWKLLSEKADNPRRRAGGTNEPRK